MTTNPFGGRLGSMAMTCWVAPAPTGRDEAFVLLTTEDERAPATMGLIADLLGLRAGAPPSLEPMESVHLELGADGWAGLVIGDERLERPVRGEFVDLAWGNRRVVLVVGTAPMPAGMDVDLYTARHGASAAIGLAPVRLPS